MSVALAPGSRESIHAAGHGARQPLVVLSPRSFVMPSFARPILGEMPMPNFTWDHIHLRTPDPEAMAQWFERMFGAEIIRSTQLGKPRIDIKLGGAMIFTAQVNPGDGVNAAPTEPYQALDHLGLAVCGMDGIGVCLTETGAAM